MELSNKQILGCLEKGNPFANENRFPHARQVRVAPDFDNAFDELNIDSRSYSLSKRNKGSMKNEN